MLTVNADQKMLTENADLKGKATRKIFPVNQNIFGVPR